ncbi:Zn-dependent hydrolase [Acidisoma silvae]|uniref:Zn-dependent hydrolase n=1 Tax=Acidisoma silvae TaxID=2802396 RepID=A0A963YRH0_9PROT|nr:Zn-dependent hydrolase [Acidisoma silvae]MCB8874985.1 Zn-dependent hydrolase [Acidisoma silvae]
MSLATNLAIDPARLWDSILDTARIGGTAKGGIKRLTLTELDAEVRRWFIAACEAAGCAVTIDDMGNIFARRPGKDNGLPPIAIGSHLDTQPTGGKFDGIIGVLSGLELLRTLQDAGYETTHPIEVINWTNEEGSRFAPAMLSSGVFAGKFTKDWAYAREDRDGIRFGDALRDIGFIGDEACGAHPLAAHFELHIEQGPILEAEAKTIGVVTGVQGMRWYEVTVTGVDSHAGSTPMYLRQDALVATARMIEVVQQIALEHAPNAVGTVGLIEARPNSRNVIPGETFFTVDFRDPDDSVLSAMEQKLTERLATVAASSGVAADLTCIWNSPAVHFDADCVTAVRAAAVQAGFPHRDIISGAGHDSAYVASVAPTTMIFVPCAGGISHNEIESAEPGDVAAGATVLLQAVLAMDAKLSGQS